MIKQRVESIDVYKKNNREDLLKIDLFSKTKIADEKLGLIEVWFFRFVVNYNS